MSLKCYEQVRVYMTSVWERSENAGPSNHGMAFIQVQRDRLGMVWRRLKETEKTAEVG